MISSWVQRSSQTFALSVVQLTTDALSLKDALCGLNTAKPMGLAVSSSPAPARREPTETDRRAKKLHPDEYLVGAGSAFAEGGEGGCSATGAVQWHQAG